MCETCSLKTLKKYFLSLKWCKPEKKTHKMHTTNQGTVYYLSEKGNPNAWESSTYNLFLGRKLSWNYFFVNLLIAAKKPCVILFSMTFQQCWLLVHAGFGGFGLFVSLTQFPLSLRSLSKPVWFTMVRTTVTTLTSRKFSH